LTEEVDGDNLREKIIALKSSVDSLIIHGIDPKTTLKLHRIIVEDYMVVKDRVLRQIAIEGICKMLFSRKLTQDAEHSEVEFLLSQLIIQWFDRKYNWQNSLVRQILNVFFKSFVLFSQERTEHMMRALTKVVYAILESKYPNEKQAPKPKAKVEAHKPKGRRKASDDDSDSAYQEDQSYVSDDSRCQLNQAFLEKICAELDPL